MGVVLLCLSRWLGQRKPVQRPCSRSRLGMFREQQQERLEWQPGVGIVGGEISKPWRTHGAVLWAIVRRAAYTSKGMGTVGEF